MNNGHYNLLERYQKGNNPFKVLTLATAKKG